MTGILYIDHDISGHSRTYYSTFHSTINNLCFPFQFDIFRKGNNQISFCIYANMYKVENGAHKNMKSWYFYISSLTQELVYDKFSPERINHSSVNALRLVLFYWRWNAALFINCFGRRKKSHANLFICVTAQFDSYAQILALLTCSNHRRRLDDDTRMASMSLLST